MTQEEREDGLRQSYESRIETLNALYKRFMLRLGELDHDNAISYSTPMCDVLLLAISDLENKKEMTDINNTINNILKDEK